MASKRKAVFYILNLEDDGKPYPSFADALADARKDIAKGDAGMEIVRRVAVVKRGVEVVLEDDDAGN